jgi:hypothetical protein
MSDNIQANESVLNQRVTYSFDYHKKMLQSTSADLHLTIKTMSWRAKSALLASD